jgi:hypothetical protein
MTVARTRPAICTPNSHRSGITVSDNVRQVREKIDHEESLKGGRRLRLCG